MTNQWSFIAKTNFISKTQRSDKENLLVLRQVYTADDDDDDDDVSYSQ